MPSVFPCVGEWVTWNNIVPYNKRRMKRRKDRRLVSIIQGEDEKRYKILK